MAPSEPVWPDPVPNVTGRKDDSGKLDLSLFFDDMPNAIEHVTRVLQWAVTDKKPVPYERGSWQAVSDLQRRYRAAQLRHELSLAKQRAAGSGDRGRDHETNLLELAHIATCAMFRLEMAVRDENRRLMPPTTPPPPPPPSCAYDPRNWGRSHYRGAGLNGLGS